MAVRARAVAAVVPMADEDEGKAKNQNHAEKSRTEQGLSFKQADARARSKLSIERTYAAWVRTSIAIIVVGLAIAEFLVGRNDPMRPHFTALGLAFVFAGLLVSAFSLYDYYRARDLLREMEFKTPKRWIVVITGMVGGLTFVLFAVFLYRAFFM